MVAHSVKYRTWTMYKDLDSSLQRGSFTRGKVGLQVSPFFLLSPFSTSVSTGKQKRNEKMDTEIGGFIVQI